MMVATDIAARGLDLEGLDDIVNFEQPTTLERFIHRSGRTGRAGKEGTVMTFISEENSSLFKGIVEILSDNQQIIPSFLKTRITRKEITD